MSIESEKLEDKPKPKPEMTRLRNTANGVTVGVTVEKATRMGPEWAPVEAAVR